MLVLARQLNETIIIDTPTGDRLKIKVVNLRRDQVKLGIDAPRSYDIRREELPPYDIYREELPPYDTHTHHQ